MNPKLKYKYILSKNSMDSPEETIFSYSTMNGCAGCAVKNCRGHHSHCGHIVVYVNNIS